MHASIYPYPVKSVITNTVTVIVENEDNRHGEWVYVTTGPFGCISKLVFRPA